MTTKGFYNTVYLKSEKIKLATQKALAQEDKVYLMFLEHPGQKFTPTEVHEKLGGERFGRFTSVHRCLSNLTDKGLIEKMDMMVPGPYGKPNHTWRLSPVSGSQGSLF